MHYIFINVVIAKATEEIMHSLSEILSIMYEIFFWWSETDKDLKLS